MTVSLDLKFVKAYKDLSDLEESLAPDIMLKLYAYYKQAVLGNTFFMEENDSIGYADITKNWITDKLPFSYLIKGKKFSMDTKMDVLNWNAKSSLDSLNLICKERHKGLDGISKTWSEVAINITSTF